MDAAVRSLAPDWYCPGCGSRYFGPGLCTNGHQAQELLKDETAASAALGAADDGDLLGGDRTAGASAAATDAVAAAPADDVDPLEEIDAIGLLVSEAERRLKKLSAQLEPVDLSGVG